jgi:hypothetical protein
LDSSDVLEECVAAIGAAQATRDLARGQEACKRPPIDLTPGWWRQSPETGWKRAAAGPREKARPDMLDTTFAVDVLPAKNFCKIALKKHRLTELCNFGRS